MSVKRNVTVPVGNSPTTFPSARTPVNQGSERLDTVRGRCTEELESMSLPEPGIPDIWQPRPNMFRPDDSKSGYRPRL
jgi:hypothetical protein